MQTYDVLMVLVLIGATVFGFWKGMAWQIASLASFVASYFVSLRFSEQVSPFFQQAPFNLQPPLNRFAAMLAIYVGTSFIIWMLFRLVSGVIDKVRLESFDKQLGAMFGFAKGVLLCVGITFFAVTLAPEPQGQAIVASQSGRYIVAMLDKAHTVFPPELHQVVDPYLNTIEQRLNPNFQPHGETLQQLWQNQVNTHLPSNLPANLPNNMPQIPWPQMPQAQQPSPQQIPWPTPNQQPAWPTTEQSPTAWPQPQPTPPRTADMSNPYKP